MADHPSGEVSRTDDESRRAYGGNAWRERPPCAVREGVTAKVATARPPTLGHSIWAPVVHLAAWDDFVARRIAEARVVEEPDEVPRP